MHTHVTFNVSVSIGRKSVYMYVIVWISVYVYIYMFVPRDILPRVYVCYNAQIKESQACDELHTF